MSRTPRSAVLHITLAIALASRLCAQDTRTVIEPSTPPPCIALQATLTPPAATSGEIESRAYKAGAGQSGLDTARLQQAIDRCAPGTAVELAPDTSNSAFLIGPIYLRAGVTLLIDKGVTVYAARNPEIFAVTPGSCGVVNDESATGCHPLITVKSASNSAIMGDGVIDAQGGAPMIIDGKPSPNSWWDLAANAPAAGHAQAPRLIDTDLSDNFTLYRISLRNSTGVNLAFHRGDGLTVWALKIDTPKATRNTAGIVLTQSKNITVTQSFLRTGDDAVAIQASDGPTSNITIAHNHLYWGRGITIGDDTIGGVTGIRIQDLSLDGPDFSIRILSRATHGGPVQNVVYDDVCIRDSRNPIVFDSAFSFPAKGIPQLPVYQDITLHNLRLSGGGRVQFNGFDNTHRVGITLDGVISLDGPQHYRAQANHADLSFGPGPVNLIFTGDDSTVTGKEVNGALPSCAAKFVPFP